MNDTPQSGTPFNFKPEAKVSTNWASIGAVVLGTSIVVGGLFSIKADISSAVKDASEAKEMVREIRNDLYQLRVQLGAHNIFTAHPSSPSPHKATP